LLPDQVPEAEQEVAFVAFHRNVELVPLTTVLGVATTVIVGDCGFTDTVTD
jgi:hypothetical protein